MGDNFTSILEAARQLSPDEQRELAQRLLNGIGEDPILQLGTKPVDDEVSDASLNHDRYIYRS
jgi:hypothetical protein